MKSINRKSCLVIGLLALLSLGVFLGKGASPFIPSATAQAAENAVGLSPTNMPATNEVVASETSDSGKQPARNASSDRVRIGGSQKLGANEAVKDLVTVFGSSDAAGTMEHDMVTVFGSAKMSGTVNHDMVTVFNGAKMNGKVGHDMATIFGNVEVNGPVDHDLVAVFGSIKLGPNAKVGNDCVAVFGKTDRNPKAVLAHEPVEVFPWFSSVGDYIRTGPMMGRLLPPGSGLAWIVVALFFLLYLLVAVILPKPTAACVRQLDSRPILSFGVGILTMILLVPLHIILVATGVGIVLIPFIGLAETALAVLGKTAALEFFGLQILRRISPNADNRPVFAFLIGFILVTMLYMVPILALLVWLALRPFALGAALLSVFGSIRKNGNGGTPPASGVPVQVASPLAAATASPVPPVLAGVDVGAATAQPFAPPPPTPPNVMTGAEVAVMPRAGFWIRLAATALDFILLVWFLPFAHAFFPLLWLAYHVAMWSWKGTTIGGIVCNLKLVRADGRPVDFAVALVRGLASVFSFVALFLGFFWVGWTRERQSWHDLIAGTVIVRVPKAISLV